MCRLKINAERDDRWIMLNVQDPDNFQSLQINADLWNDALIQDLMHQSFHFAQRVLPSADAQQLKDSYQLYVLPAVLIIDPNTGQKMHEWRGSPAKERFMEDLLPFLDTPPSDPRAGALRGCSVSTVSSHCWLWMSCSTAECSFA